MGDNFRCARNSKQDKYTTGSHDSFTFALDANFDIANDIPEMVKGMPPLPTIKQVIYNWSKTQTLDTVQQLNAGTVPVGTQRGTVTLN